MSVKVMGSVWDSSLSRDEKYVLLSYADHAAHDGTSIYPSVKRMSWKTGYSTRSIQRITRTLETKGILVPDGNGPHGVNRWRIDIDKLPQRPPYQSERGDKMTPLETAGGDNLSGGGDKNDTEGVTICQGGVTPCQGGGDTMTPDPSIESSVEPSLESPVETTEPRAQNPETPQERLARLRKTHGTDPLDFMAKQAEKENGRPLGWATVAPHIWEVCQAVASICRARMPVLKEHYNGTSAEMAQKAIDKWQSGAEILSDVLEENGRDATEALSDFMTSFEGGFTIAGPQSLVNVIPAFLAQGDRQSEPAGFAGLQAWAQQEGWT